jgi:hypothetical protein
MSDQTAPVGNALPKNIITEIDGTHLGKITGLATHTGMGWDFPTHQKPLPTGWVLWVCTGFFLCYWVSPSSTSASFNSSCKEVSVLTAASCCLGHMAHICSVSLSVHHGKNQQINNQWKHAQHHQGSPPNLSTFPHSMI